jgi:C4-dicarboxylate transporter, DctM subunit
VILLCLILALALLGAPLFVIIGAATGAAFFIYTEVIDGFWSLGVLVDPIEELLGMDPFLAIPLFIASGAIMTKGGMADRLVAVARAGLGWMPGGLGITAVIACMVFAAISGNSPVTLIAVGSILFPAMVRYGYPENFSLGLVMTAGSLGCLVMPALILLIYAIAVSGIGVGSVDPSDMFVAALVPAILIALLLSIYSYWVGRGIPHRDPFSWRALGKSFIDGFWALLLPVLVLGGILGGFYPPFKAGAVAVVYSLVVTVFIYRELDLRGVIRALAEAGRLMGMLILIIGLAFALNKLLAILEVERHLVELIVWLDLGPIGFMLLVNFLLIVLGALMDSVSATLVFAPILAPIAVKHFGIDPLHFGVVFVVNMEIGYLAPPVATNLFVASALFQKPFAQVCRAILPGLGITCAALVLFMYVPTVSKGLVNYQRGQPIYEPFPWDGKPSAQALEAAPSVDLESLSEEAAERAAEETGDLNLQSDDEYYFGDEDGTGEEEDDDDWADVPL